MNIRTHLDIIKQLEAAARDKLPPDGHEYDFLGVEDTLEGEAIAEIGRLRVIERAFGEIMAVMHGDGGHYLDEHGPVKAVEGAIRIRHDLVLEVDRLRAPRKAVPMIVPKPCFTCRHFLPPEWINPTEQGNRRMEVGTYGRCARFHETRLGVAGLHLVTGIMHDDAARATDARVSPEMCGPDGQAWEGVVK